MVRRFKDVLFAISYNNDQYATNQPHFTTLGLTTWLCLPLLSILIQRLLFHHFSIIHRSLISHFHNHDQWIMFHSLTIHHDFHWSVGFIFPSSHPSTPNRHRPQPETTGVSTVVPSCGRPAHPPGACERAPWPPACRDAAPRAPFAWAARRVHNGSPMDNNQAD